METCRWQNKGMRLSYLLVLSALLSACATTSHVNVEHSPATIVLISVDGLRPDDVDGEQMPNLTRIGQQGVRATMRPSYPSLTFPNHYTLVTGLRPDHHGIVHNQMTDADLGEFRVSNKTSVRERKWWGGEPIWVSVIKQGGRAFTAFWPGSEAPIHEVHPTRWLPFDESVSSSAQAKNTIAWLNLPRAERARFITVYFSQVDKASHDYGPASREARLARTDIDAAIASIAKEIASRPPRDNYNLVVVSDHGFAEVHPGQQISTSAILSPEVATPVSDGQVIGFKPKPGKELEVQKAIDSENSNYRCYAKENLPERWHFGKHPRVPPIICQMAKGWDALFPAVFARAKAFTTRGSHGYDPDLPEMVALFIARGPSFAQGVELPRFDNVNVYPLLMDVLDIPAQPHDGDLESVRAAEAPDLK